MSGRAGAAALLAAALLNLSLQAAVVFPAPPKIHSIETAGSHLYVGAGRAGLFRSDDGGESWTRVASAGAPVGVVEADPRQPETIWISTADATLVSRDDGVSWSEVMKQAYAAAPISNGAAIGAAVGGLFRLLDLENTKHIAGRDWSIGWDVVASGAGVLAVIGSMEDATSGELWLSSDAGRSWETLRTVGLVDAIAMSADGRLMLMAQRQKPLELSVNGGKSWQAVPLDGEATALAITPAGAPRIYAAMLSGDETVIHASDDRGRSWQTVSRIRAIVGVIAPAGDEVLIATSDRIYRMRPGEPLKRIAHEITEALAGK